MDIYIYKYICILMMIILSYYDGMLHTILSWMRHMKYMYCSYYMLVWSLQDHEHLIRRYDLVQTLSDSEFLKYWCIDIYLKTYICILVIIRIDEKEENCIEANVQRTFRRYPWVILLCHQPMTMEYSSLTNNNLYIQCVSIT